MTMQFGKYQLIEKLGEGRYGIVFRATDITLERDVALKILKPEWAQDAAFALVFAREAKTAARLRQANLVVIYEIGQVEGRHYISMEYLNGQSLHERLEQAREAGAGGLPLDEALRLAGEIAAGLAELHRHQIVHCDLKPANILLDEHGRAKVGDLGLARSYTASLSSGASRSMPLHSPGTPAYMSPEQEANLPFLRPASDVYSLGLIIYELLTLRNYKLEAPGTRLGTVRPNLPDWLDDLLVKMLEKDFEKRLWDGEKALLALLAGAQAPQAAPQPGVEAPLRQAEEAPAARKLAEQPTHQPAPQQAERERQPAQESSPRKSGETAENYSKVKLAPGVELELVRVPAGEFQMGSSDGEDYEKPVHKVFLDEYWIGKYPVTNAQYAVFIKANDRPAPEGFSNYQPPAGKENHPVVNVTWLDAMAFCRWAGKSTGLGFCLPTEAEWEKAARGSDGRRYPWGNEPLDPNRCNYGNIIGTTTPVDDYSPAGDGPYGCADMAGNVLEWCADWFDAAYYSQSPDKNPTGPANSQYRVLRGGSFYLDDIYVRSANRNYYGPPVYKNHFIGFRCVTSRWS